MAAVRMIALAGMMLVFGLVAPKRAEASFGSCTDGAYLAHFDERLGEIPHADECVERLRLEVNTRDGISTIRLIHDFMADWAMAPGLLPEAERGLRAAASALERIGAFSMDDVTVLLIDGPPPRTPDGSGFIDAAGMTGAEPGQECRIGLWLLSDGGDPANVAYALAHELFHCVQHASLRPSQIATSREGVGQGGDWWIEGSAEWFAALSLPDMAVLSDRISAFDEMSAETALNEFAYSGVVFFLWFGGERGPSAILPLLERMADDASVDAQRAAMAAALAEADWLRFAQDYLDRRISHPHGVDLGFNPSDGDEWVWERTRTQTIALEPFVLTRGHLQFECGRWATSTSVATSHAVREAEGGDWGPLPALIEAQEGEEARYRFAGIAGGGGRVDLRIEGRMEAGCTPCAESRAIDQCVVGAWRQTGGGAVEWMRRNMPPGVQIPSDRLENPIAVFEEGGAYWTFPVTVDMTMLLEERRGVTRAEGRATAQSSGRWSAEGGRLNLCADAEGMSGQLTVTNPEGTSRTVPVGAPPSSGPMSWDYSCSAGSLETRLSFPGIGDPMVTQYSAISAPAGETE